eukprot:TRINITY_DN10849_c0_g1_i1.p1 TRINITY_DN10849_c0_g1~~TRINITY_DN10849_c0_g1_i1.p1  ORF type:complete len:103 (-),score=9.20 TRINITY_DN10849_c0_g1_i1:43-351(-)
MPDVELGTSMLRLTGNHLPIHMAIRVYGHVIDFGPDGLGIDREPDRNYSWTYQGTTKASYASCKAIATLLASKDYSLLRNNCQHFGNKLVRILLDAPADVSC